MTATCPLDYATDPAALREAAPLVAETLYVVGGLYGNPEALAAVLALKAREEKVGSPVRLVFNGDFHWFDVARDAFRQVGEAALAHVALRGNVETELAREGDGLDCGCGYPDYVEPAVVARSNAIFARLWATARAEPEQRTRLAALPQQCVAEVGGRRIAILHGDPQSLAGWLLAEEALRGLDGAPAVAADGCAAAPQTAEAQVADWFRLAGVDAFATTHTCLPFARDFRVDGEARLVINNGSAGMPNFRGRRIGLLTRISERPEPPPGSLYGIALGGVRYDALPVPYDHERWLRRFLADWPPGSPAHASYHARIVEGPDYLPAQAVRGTVQAAATRRSA